MPVDAFFEASGLVSEFRFVGMIPKEIIIDPLEESGDRFDDFRIFVIARSDSRHDPLPLFFISGMEGAADSLTR